MDCDPDEIEAFRRTKRFTPEETDVLVRVVRARKHRIYGTTTFREARKTWDEIAEIVSTIEGVTRTGDKCRKRYNDVRRRGNQKIAALKNTFVESPTTSKPEDEAHSPKFGGLELGLHGALKAEPVEYKSYREMDDSEEDSKATLQTPSVNVLRLEDQPFLDLQQSGFNMLETELQGVRQVMASLHARLNGMEVLLRPIEQISVSLKRIANVVDRLPPQLSFNLFLEGN